MDLDLEYLRYMKLKYTMYYLLRKKNDKEKYILFFAGSPQIAIEYIYKQTQIETEFVKEIECENLEANKENAKITIDFIPWLSKKTNSVIEKYKFEYFSENIYFIQLKEAEIEQIETLFNTYIIEKLEDKKDYVQASLF